MVGKGLAGGDILRTGAACRPRRRTDQRDQGANGRQTYNAVMRMPTALGPRDGEDGSPASNSIWHATLLVQ
jgi:hypothetical protein